MENFVVPMDLVVVLWKILDLIKSWESSHKLNLIMNLLVAILLLICLILLLPFLQAWMMPCMCRKRLMKYGSLVRLLSSVHHEDLLLKPVQVLVLAVCSVKLLAF